MSVFGKKRSLTCGWSFSDFSKLFEAMPFRRFWQSNKKGTVVSVSVPDCSHEQNLQIVLQRPVRMSDIKDGKLAPVAVTRIKRRGGKVQTCVNLSLEGAEALHKVLGDALKDARAKQRKKHISAFAANLMLLVLQTKRQ